MARHVTARELDLGRRDSVDASTVKDSLNALPGFRTSAAFFTFLRANLVLPPTITHSAMSSNTSTPLLTPSTSQTLPPPPPSPLSTSTTPSNPPDLSSIPPLTTLTLTELEDRILALKLVADSIAQQRQAAAKAIIFHPLTLALWVLMVAVVYQWLYKVRSDMALVVTTSGGLSMAMLVAVRAMISGYITEAEKMNLDYLVSPDGDEDLVLGTKFGADLIAVLILRLERPGGTGKKRGSKSNVKGGKGIIRAWTTRLRYRRTGVGRDLLEEAVRVTKGRLGKDAEVGFAADHANSKILIPWIFEAGFRRKEQNAIRMLEGVLEGGGQKKR